MKCTKNHLGCGDFEGHEGEDDVRKLFKQLNNLNAEVKILGSFPKAIT